MSIKNLFTPGETGKYILVNVDLESKSVQVISGKGLVDKNALPLKRNSRAEISARYEVVSTDEAAVKEIISAARQNCANVFVSIFGGSGLEKAD